MYPVAVRQAVKLSGNPQVGCLFTAGGTDPAVSGVGDVFNTGLSQPYSFTPLLRVPQARILVTASTSISRRPPASRKDVQHWLAVNNFLSGRELKPETTGQINSLCPTGG